MSAADRCPSCNEVIFADGSACRYCGVTADPWAADHAIRQMELVNSACSTANNIKVGDVVAAFFLAGQVFIVVSLVIPGPLVYAQILPLSALGVSLAWFQRFASVQSADPDFVEAKRAVSRSFYIWTATFVLQVILLAALALRILYR